MVCSRASILVLRVPRRHLFSKLNPKNIIEKDELIHHEYSIRPDTFAFKVAEDRTRGFGKKRKEEKDSDSNGSRISGGKVHPFQKNVSEGTVPTATSFNPIQFIYQNSTNYPFDVKSPQQVYNEYPLTTSAKLARLKERPRRVKMASVDFIEDSLYNPNYGYFSKEVEIFHPDKPFDYNNIEDVDEFMESWEKAYSKYDSISNKFQNQSQINDLMMAADLQPSGQLSKYASMAKTVYKQDVEAKSLQQSGKRSKRSLQLWHTPTELFQPYYGEALARYILVNYKLNGSYPYHDLIIYEMGGGNGTMMCNILNYIKENEPDVYARTTYKIIEISSQLAHKQLSSALRSKLTSQGLDTSKLEIINQSIFAWNKVVESPCFFIALEVFDNFSHDLIRYDNETGIPHEGRVLIDDKGDFYEFFTPQLSQYSQALLTLRENGTYPILKNLDKMKSKWRLTKSWIPLVDKDVIHPLEYSTTKLKWMNRVLPFKDNLTPGEFIPTRLLQFFHILQHKFPQHSLICSDFNYLPKTIPGYYNAPLVQTVLQDRMVDVSTYMCYQGYFDIMFATDFNLALDLYKQVVGKVARVESHKEFLEQWADIDATTTKKGENPMLDFYTNVSFMVS